MSVKVLKFGGSTFADEGDFRRVASFLARRIEARKERLIVVVSAQPDLTESLRRKALKLSPAPSFESVDSLLPLADTVSMALLRLACDESALRATSLCGHQLGILTDSNFSAARIRQVDSQFLWKALDTSDIVVVPGGQGVDRQGRLTWLGKNSSDLTAVALAAAMGAKSCEIYSDVSGIHSADPNLIKHTKLLREISYSDAIEMSFSGAKMMHYGALSYAQREGVSIVCRSNQGDFEIGTRIGTLTEPLRAVVVDTRSDVVDFRSRQDRDKAMLELEKINIPAIEIDMGDIYCCVITCGFFDVQRYFLDLGVGSVRHASCLVSEFMGDGDLRRHIVSTAEAIPYGQMLHDALYQAA